MSIRQKWIGFLYRTATGSARVRMLLAPLGAFVFFVFVSLFVLSAWLMEAWLRLPKLFSWPNRVVVSAPFLGIGAILVIWCNIHFIKAKGTPVPLSPPQRLVKGGPYRYSRNPMLTGIFIILFGLGILMGSMLLMFVFTPLFIILNALELKHIEEPELEKRLGEQYIEYKKRVPMFFPKFLFKKK